MVPAINEQDSASMPILELANTNPPRLPEGRLQSFSPEFFQPVSYSESRENPDRNTLQNLPLDYVRAQVDYPHTGQQSLS